MHEQEINTITDLVIDEETNVIVNSTQQILNTFYSNIKRQDIINKGNVVKPFSDLIFNLLEG
jgi:hypothetical protein